MREEQEIFDQLVAEYYQAWFRYHPEAAVDVGIESFAASLAPHGDDDIGAQLVLNEKLLAALESLDKSGLDDDRSLDYQVLQGAAILEHHELLERDWRRRDPVRFLPLHAIYQLTIRPVSDFAGAISRRLAAIPVHLRSARTELAIDPQQIPASWLEAAIQEAHSGAVFLRDLHRHPRIHLGGAAAAPIPHLADEAAHALEEFARFLETELSPHAAGDFACGRAHFERILRYRHFLNISVDELYQYGENLFAETQQAMREECRKIRGDEDIAALNLQIHADLPKASELMSCYRERMQQAHTFVETSQLVTVPARQKLKVVETPNFLRHEIPFAAYVEPSPADPEQCGYYYVTPPESNEDLQKHHLAGIGHTCVHEAWPGHHLQFVTANLDNASRTLPRLLNPSATLYEGWALYSEQIMRDSGFLDRPEQGFILLQDRLWRALRVQLDVDLQVNGVESEKCAGRLMAAMGFSRGQAKSEILWYTRAPGVPMGYAAGWSLITALRKRLEAQDKGFALRAFHDRLLASGSIALPLVIDRQFGEDVRSHSINAAFGIGQTFQ